MGDSGPRWVSLSGLMMDRTVWTAPSAMSRLITLISLPCGSRILAPGWLLIMTSSVWMPSRSPLPEPGVEHPGNIGAAVDRAGDAGALGPAVAVEDGVVGEQSDEPAHVASLAGGEEPFGEPVALLPRGLEAWRVAGDPPAGPARER